MSVTCGKCNSLIVSAEISAKCVDCDRVFHASCVTTQNVTKAKLKTWKCDTCRSENASLSSLRSGDEADDKKWILDAMTAMKDGITTHIDKKIDSVQASITTLSEDLRHLNSKVTVVEEEQSNLRRRCDELEQANAELQSRLHDVEQHSRSANVEIQGLPLTTGENIYNALSLIASVIGVPYKREDVSIAHRLKLYSRKHAHPPVIVQFVSRGVKEQWLAAARAKKGIDASKLASSLQQSTIYINEHLTAHNKALLGRARRMIKEKKLHFAGFYNGKVLIKRREGDDSERITSMEQLNKYAA